jgi:hypothetical protein
MEVWKFTTVGPHEDQQPIEMPAFAEILSVGVQGHDIVLWALVEPTAVTETRMIAVIGTGWHVPDGKHKFVGTVQMAHLVWHVFDCT